MTRKQLLAIAGIGLAVAVLAVLAIRTDAAARFPLPPGNDPGARMAYAAQWLLLPALTLLAGIAGTGIWRFFSPEGFDGTPVPETRKSCCATTATPSSRSYSRPSPGRGSRSRFRTNG